MFGELAPRLKGGFNALIAAFTSSTSVTLKTPATTSLTIQAGDPVTAASTGTALTVQAGAGGSTSGTGGATVIKGGAATTGVGGSVTVVGGVSAGSNGTGGAAALTGGAGGNTASDGGAVTVTGGAAYPSSVGAGGAVTIKGGLGNSGGAGGTVTIQPGDGGSGTTTGAAVNINGGVVGVGTGGAVNLTGAPGSGTNKDGGAVVVTGGAPTGTGARGNTVLNGTGSALATSATGGFTCIPSCAGTPTGTPASIPTGTVPIVYDSTNSIYYAYSTSWKGLAGLAANTFTGLQTLTSLTTSSTVRLNGGAGLVGVNTTTPLSTAQLSIDGTATQTFISFYDTTNSKRGYINWANNNLVFYRDGALETLRVDGSGNITVASLAGTGSRAVVADTNGVLSAPVSDERLKVDIAPLDLGIETVKALKPVTFFWNADNQNRGTGPQIGWTAQSMQKVLPELVGTMKADGLMYVNDAPLIAVLTNALQQAIARIEDLERVVFGD
jgi:hypothetical protein